MVSQLVSLPRGRRSVVNMAIFHQNSTAIGTFAFPFTPGWKLVIGKGHLFSVFGSNLRLMPCWSIRTLCATSPVMTCVTDTHPESFRTKTCNANL